MAEDSLESEKGARAAKLDEILERSLKQTMRACSYDKLVSCFPTLAKNDPETLKHAQEQVNEFLTSACRSEFNKILKERHAVERLNELDELITDAKARKESGQHATENVSDLPPDVILRAHMLPMKRSKLSTMSGQLNEVQQHNADALKIVEEQRKHIELRTRTLKESLSTLDTVRFLYNR